MRLEELNGYAAHKRTNDGLTVPTEANLPILEANRQLPGQ